MCLVNTMNSIETCGWICIKESRHWAGSFGLNGGATTFLNNHLVLLCLLVTVAMCEMQRVENMIVSCEENGMFQPLQCRRTDVRRDEDGGPLPTAVNCYCANRTDGRAIENTRRLNITRRVDCASRSMYNS